jgi:hypothetical protein
MNAPRTRRLRIVAQDPSVKNNERILTATVTVPAEEFSAGPNGYRVHVIDYDSSTGTHYIPHDYPPLQNGQHIDPFETIKNDDIILKHPHFHAQNVYAIVMRTLARFEFALGRRISWGFDGHQINVAPHAFADANAFYSKFDRALMFGYFVSPTSGDHIFTSLSHDIVVHETTHALVDGLRERFIAPSSPEQAGFHEGFADVVALLSVFSLQEVIAFLLDSAPQNPDIQALNLPPPPDNPDLVDADYLQKEVLEQSILFGLADQMGQEMTGVRGRALRRSILIAPIREGGDPYLGTEAFDEPHRCGELFVAAMMNAFLEVWLKRIERLKRRNTEKQHLDRLLVIEQGADAADHLLTMAIRALDYTPPTDIRFSDYLSAFLTADFETVPDDTRYGYRDKILKSFQSYGISPSSFLPTGIWQPESEIRDNLVYDRTHFESLMREPNEVFRFLWDNRKALGVDERAYTHVQSVRPCLRIAPDGFILRETVAEYVQIIELHASELEQLNPPIGKPDTMPDDTPVKLHGGGTLIFDEYGRLKYHIANRIFNSNLVGERLDYLWKYGHFSVRADRENPFSQMHLRRSAVFSNHFVEEEF